MLRSGSDGGGRVGGVDGVGDGTAVGSSDAVGVDAVVGSSDAGVADADVIDAAPGMASVGAVGAGGDPPGVLALRRLGAAGLAGLGRDELLGVLGDIERLANRLAGYRVEVLGALDALSRSGAAPDPTPHLTLRDAAGVSEREARRMSRSAEKARANESVLGALRSGDITPAQAEALCDARVPEDVRAELVSAAAAEGTDATRRRVRQAEADHCAETPMERFARQRQMRGAGWQRDHEGMFKLWARFDPHMGAQVEAILEALRRQFWNDDKQVRNGRRSPAQRDADALAYALAGITCTDEDAAAVDRLHALARRQGLLPTAPPASQGTTPRTGAANGATAGREKPVDTAGEAQVVCDDGLAMGQGLPPAQISVLIGLDALRRQTDEMGLTDAGIELPPEVVRGLACDSEIIPLILGGPGGSADVGRARRTVPLRLRRLLIARDRHCQWPGCHQPPSRCDAHHVEHWVDGGPTKLDNLVLLCHRHHHHLHEHGYRMVPQPDGTWAATQDVEPNPTPRRSTAQARAP